MAMSINDLAQIGAMSSYLNGDKEPLVKLLSGNDNLLPETRDFLAKIVEGKVSVKDHRPKKLAARDDFIYTVIDYLITNEGYRLTDNRLGQGAAALVAEWYGLTEDATLQVYRRRKNRQK